MPKGFSKKSRYEILAILRDDCRIKSTLELQYQENIWQSTLKKIDSHCFYVEQTSLTTLQDVEYNFILHSQLGKIEFATSLLMGEEKNKQKHIHCFKIPEKINILQRRISPRINLSAEGEQFYFSGHYKNGESYRFTINDISEGGASFIVNSCQAKFISKEQILNNVAVIFAEYGSTVTSLKVINATVLHSEKPHDMERVRISCSFHKKNSETHNFLENLILQLIIDKKNRTRYF
ncbi:TPA: PilZ domain-containing protein [Klebsiella michiganensis]|nr:PilZ domain-containing protein [Klebsiella michiganensis]